MDRQADFLDLLVEQRTAAPQVCLMLGAKVDRLLGRDKPPDAQTVSRRLSRYGARRAGPRRRPG